jgi:hypothetical protein
VTSRVTLRLKRAVSLIRLVPRLGISSVCRVALYRLKKRLGLLRFLPPPTTPSGLVFEGSAGPEIPFRFEQELFGWFRVMFDCAPNWHANPFTGTDEISSDISWMDAMKKVPYDADIKWYWELSRFYWVPELAERFNAGDSRALTLLNTWVADWVDKNPPYLGINWACGQEASIRVLNLLLASISLQSCQEATPLLRWMVRAHAMRIFPTLHYAIGQDNNHGSTEAAALFIAGNWLASHENDAESRRWAECGRRWLIDRASVLILADGTGNQYSATYHRANLEIFALSEYWRKKLKLEPFPSEFYKRVIAGGKWLQQLVDPLTGDAPNYGSNDGSHLFSFSRTKYRDFRPTVELVATIFDESSVYNPEHLAEDRVSKLSLPKPRKNWQPPVGQTYKDGGHHVLRLSEAVAYLRFPKFLFRPGHADALHLDLWINSTCIFRDGGTYSYIDSAVDLTGIAAHNAIQFDEQEQMPRVGRFLFGDWLSARKVIPVHKVKNVLAASAGYTNHFGAWHDRSVELSSGVLKCTDEVGGRARSGTLRWRLAKGNWEKSGQSLRLGEIQIEIFSSSKILHFELVDGLESTHYQLKESTPVLEVRFALPATVVTQVKF